MTLRRVSLPVLVACALVAAIAHASYQKTHFDGSIGAKGERRPFTLTYEKLSKSKRLVNNVHFTKLAVDCHEPKADKVVKGQLAAFNQPTEAWVFNRKKKIGGRKNFSKTWKGNGVPIEAPDGSKTRFRSKRATLSGEFGKEFKTARGRFSIRWQEVNESSGAVIYACSTETRWTAKASKHND